MKFLLVGWLGSRFVFVTKINGHQQFDANIGVIQWWCIDHGVKSSLLLLFFPSNPTSSIVST
jgi:hypothetical protein